MCQPTFFLSSEPFLRSLLAIMTPMRRVSNTGSVRLDCAGDPKSPNQREGKQEWGEWKNISSNYTDKKNRTHVVLLLILLEGIAVLVGLTERQQLGDSRILLAAVQRRTVCSPEAWRLRDMRRTDVMWSFTKDTTIITILFQQYWQYASATTLLATQYFGGRNSYQQISLMDNEY